MLAARWLKRLPESYRAAVEPLIAAEDVERFEALADGRADFLVGLQDERGSDGTRRTRVAFYRRGPKVELSQATPMLEHLGLRVIEEIPARLHGDDELWIQAFGVLNADPAALHEPLALGDCRRRASPTTLEAVWRGETESDSLNRLVVSAGLRWPQVAGPARLPPLPPADRLALHRVLPERRDRRQPGDHRQADPALRAALRRRRPRGRRGRRGGAARRDPRRPRRRRRCSTTTASCATSSG